MHFQDYGSEIIGFAWELPHLSSLSQLLKKPATGLAVARSPDSTDVSSLAPEIV